jgi:hypothetical protein
LELLIAIDDDGLPYRLFSGEDMLQSGEDMDSWPALVNIASLLREK